MAYYQATPFCWEWNEDPELFLGWFLQCKGAADDKTKVRQFIYYLQADSEADEWFEELPEKEKRSWASIEVLFWRKWLKQEVISTNSVVPAQLGLKAVGKAWLFAALAFQNWSLSCAQRLSLSSGHGLWGICHVTFMHAQKKNQVTSFGWQQCDNIYICIFNSFIWI